MNSLRLLSLLAGAALLCGPARAQEPPVPPETEADAVRMLASGDYRARDMAVLWVISRTQARESIGAELRRAVLRAAESPGWSAGRPKIDPETNPDGWGEHWSFYIEAVVGLRDPAAISFMLAEGSSLARTASDLAAIGRPALLPVIEALEDPEADPMGALEVALRALTLMVHDGLPTEKELERIGAATRYRLGTRLPIYAITAVFGLAVTLGTSEVLAMLERAANNRETANAMRAAYTTEQAIKSIQERAREALQPGFVPRVIRFWRE